MENDLLVSGLICGVQARQQGRRAVWGTQREGGGHREDAAASTHRTRREARVLTEPWGMGVEAGAEWGLGEEEGNGWRYSKGERGGGGRVGGGGG